MERCPGARRLGCDAHAIGEAQRRSLYEILENRTGLRSTIVTCQYPAESWLELLVEPILAAAILDRLVRGAYLIAPTGESMCEGVAT